MIHTITLADSDTAIVLRANGKHEIFPPTLETYDEVARNAQLIHGDWVAA
jgi:hypothetical protein